MYPGSGSWQGTESMGMYLNRRQGQGTGFIGQGQGTGARSVVGAVARSELTWVRAGARVGVGDRGVGVGNYQSWQVDVVTYPWPWWTHPNCTILCWSKRASKLANEYKPLPLPGRFWYARVWGVCHLSRQVHHRGRLRGYGQRAEGGVQALWQRRWDSKWETRCPVIRHVAKGGGGGGGRPPWRPGGPFSARAARRKGPTRPREAQFLESLEVLRATRALSERPEGPMDVQRAPVQVRGSPG